MPSHDDVLGAAVQSNVPLCLWGGKGVGKSATVRTLAQKLEIPCVSLGLSGFSGESDLSEVQPWALQTAAIEGDGVLLVEPTQRLDVTVTERLIELVEKRRVGGMVLPESVRIIFTAVPRGDRSLDQGMPAELAKRLLQLDFVRLRPQDWAAWSALPPSEFSRHFNLNPNISATVKDEASFQVAQHLGGKRDWPYAWKLVARILPYLQPLDASARRLALAGLVGEWSAKSFLESVKFDAMESAVRK